MDDEFKLCWKNFQDNIASGFQNLYDRGDLVDVTLACDGKLLHAHKIVLAICSPYFQEIFITNPCKHPIIILKDVTFNIMCELLEFMYQGVVNVKHIELQSFMKIGQLLQIKGLATNSTPSAPSTSSSEKSSSQNQQNPEEVASACSDALSNTITKIELNNADNSSSKTGNTISTSIGRSQSPSSTPSPMAFTTTSTNQVNMKTSALNNPILPHPYHSLKRHADFGSDTLSIYSRKPFKRSTSSVEHIGDHNDSTTEVSMDQVNAEDFFLPTIPHISMIEPRYDLNNVKREGDRHSSSTTSVALRNSFGTAFGFDYNLYKNSTNTNSGAEYPNDLHMPNDYSKNFGNHMDIPPNGSNVVMLSSTSLLHGNCVFNRNNTVATQQGMKTYWLCKSYRVSMCRARCITHQGRVISSTGVHNHPPHMRNGNGNGNGSTVVSNATCTGYATETSQPSGVSQVCGVTGATIPSENIPSSLTTQTVNSNISVANSMSGLRLTYSSGGPNMFQPNLHGSHGQCQPLHQYTQSLSPPPVINAMSSSHPHLHVHHLAQSQSNLLIQHPSEAGVSNNQSNTVIQNMMHSAANVMHLQPLLQNNGNHHSPNIGTQSHHHQSGQIGQTLEITPLIDSSPVQPRQSPTNRSNQSIQGGGNMDSPISIPGATIKSPTHVNINEDVCNAPSGTLEQDTHILVANDTLSPCDINSNTVGSADASASSQSDIASESRHQAHVIDSITISPGNTNRHNFKIEDM